MGCSPMLVRWASAMALAAACCPVAGCRERPIGAVLTYQVDDSQPASEHVNMAMLVRALNARLDDVGKARAVDDKKIAIDLYGSPDASELKRIKRFLAAQGVLEFRIMASPQFSKHKAAIALAEQLPPDTDVVKIDDREVARWVECDAKQFGPPEEARTLHKLVVRKVGDAHQVLAMTDDGLDITGEYLRSASSDLDSSSRPAVAFVFNQKGAFKFKQLTSAHQPTPTGEKYKLGILLDNRLLSAPTLNAVISDRGIIEGLSDEDADYLLRLLNSGSLPGTIQFVGEQLKDKPKAAAGTQTQ